MRLRIGHAMEEDTVVRLPRPAASVARASLSAACAPESLRLGFARLSRTVLRLGLAAAK
jgi:hypothetical protein